VKILLSFILAGAWISGATLLGERLGSKKAGLIANLPSNIVLSLIFMALTSGPGMRRNDRGVPVGMAIDTLFVLVFMLVVKRGSGKRCWPLLVCGRQRPSSSSGQSATEHGRRDFALSGGVCAVFLHRRVGSAYPNDGEKTVVTL